MKHLARVWPAYASAAVFVLVGSAFVNEPGLEEDEAMFATAVFRDWVFFALQFGKHRLPLMHMSYVGALKTWLWTPLFWIWQPTVAAIRFPALLLGAAGIVVFWYLLEAIHGRKASVVGCFLLATDAIYLITSVLDWGPVVLQHLLMLFAMLLAVGWYQRGSVQLLCGAVFCCGLAFWDKAIFAWVFAGLVVGLSLFAGQIFMRLTVRSVGLAVLSFGVGAAPLIVYNVKSEPRFATFRSNAKIARPDWVAGLQAVRRTSNGSGLLGIPQNTSSRPHPPRHVVERIAAALHAIAGSRESSFANFGVIFAVVLLPFLWKTPARSPMLFAFVATGGGWAFSLTAGGGLSPHHIILLWPLPTMFVAVALAEMAERSQFLRLAFCGVTAILCISGLLVMNEYLYRFARYGASDAWTDAIGSLARSLSTTHASQAVVIDWGIADQLCVLNKNDPPSHPISMPINDSDIPVLADEKAVWVEHTKDHEIFKGVNDAVRAAAADHGYVRQELETIYDRNGRAIFETFRIVKSR